MPPRPAKSIRDPLIGFITREMIEFHALHEWIAHAAYRDFWHRTRMPRAHKLAAEELSHFRILEKLYPRSWGTLRPAVRRRLERVRIPRICSELEFLVASWIYDFAGLVQVEGLQRCAWVPYRIAACSILREEREHREEGLEELRKYLSRFPERRAKVGRFVEKWLALSERAFGSDDSPYDRIAIRAGLKSDCARKLRLRFTRTVIATASRLQRGR